jgi:hypothetical protein
LGSFPDEQITTGAAAPFVDSEHQHRANLSSATAQMDWTDRSVIYD